jgi:large subunit ribosomal protein L35
LTPIIDNGLDGGSKKLLLPLFEKNEKQVAGRQRSPTFAAPMSKNAGIAKTRKAVSKRFKITATGKVLRRKQGKRHILQNKNRKRKRNLGKVALVHETDAAAVKASMPWS